MGVKTWNIDEYTSETNLIGCMAYLLTPFIGVSFRYSFIALIYMISYNRREQSRNGISPPPLTSFFSPVHSTTRTVRTKSLFSFLKENTTQEGRLFVHSSEWHMVIRFLLCGCFSIPYYESHFSRSIGAGFICLLKTRSISPYIFSMLSHATTGTSCQMNKESGCR